VKLNADHSGVCKFGPSLEDQDNFKLVRGNMKDLYKNALKVGELNAIPHIIGLEGELNHLAELSDVVQRELRTLPPDSRSIIEREREANRLRLDPELRIAVVSVPHFQPENFQRFRTWRESNFRSSTFRLADLLEMLPAQANHDQATFQVKELQGLRDYGYPYRASCSRLGLATFICRHFYTLAAEEGHVEIRTTVGTFKIFPPAPSAMIHFFPLDRVPETHRLASGDFQSVRRFAQGQIRLSPVAFTIAHGREGSDDERWRIPPRRFMILTPSLDHPRCIRFVTQAELETLEASREICKVVMRVFIRFFDEEHPEGTGAIDEWESIMTVLRLYNDSDFVHPNSVKMVTEAYWAMCTMAFPVENERGRILHKVMDDFVDILDILKAEPVVRSAQVKNYLKEFFDQYGLPYVCCFVAQAFLASMNCSIFLTISIASPQLWLDFLTGPEVNVFVA
jgi:hypothetical protein